MSRAYYSAEHTPPAGGATRVSPWKESISEVNAYVKGQGGMIKRFWVKDAGQMKEMEIIRD